MKKKYLTPCIQALVLRHQSPLLAGSYDVINPGDPNKPAGARSFYIDIYEDASMEEETTPQNSILNDEEEWDEWGEEE